MKSIGLIKKVDKLGRLGIPKEVRQRMDLNGKVELIMTKEGLIVRKYEARDREEK